MHNDTHVIEERLRAMEETHRRNASTPGASLDVCKSCYAPYAAADAASGGCPCGRGEWVPLPAAIIEARLILEDAHREERERRMLAQEVAA